MAATGGGAGPTLVCLYCLSAIRLGRLARIMAVGMAATVTMGAILLPKWKAILIGWKCISSSQQGGSMAAALHTLAVDCASHACALACIKNPRACPRGYVAVDILVCHWAVRWGAPVPYWTYWLSAISPRWEADCHPSGMEWGVAPRRLARIMAVVMAPTATKGAETMAIML